MKREKVIYDLAIIGGGLAGLATAIEMKRKNYAVVLFEKNIYPFHRVCGEYVSMEAWAYLKFLGLQLEKMELPIINQLKISTAQGIEFNHSLKKGGIGISRYLLDQLLFQQAKNEGVKVLQNTEVVDHEFHNDKHIIKTKNQTFTAKITIGAFGKRSKLDKTLNRKMSQNTDHSSKNFVGIKYHVKANLDKNLIGLHLFKNGYCGISKVEGKDRYCLCYLCLSDDLQKYGNIAEIEKKLLSQNHYLKEYLSLERFFETPLTIAQLNFGKKSIIENHIFMLGDSAGLIVPLSGNGMSMAMHSAHYFSTQADLFLKGQLSRKKLEMKYKRWWNSNFSFQLKTSKVLQYIFYKPLLINSILRLLNKSSFLSDAIIRTTHGNDILINGTAE